MAGTDAPRGHGKRDEAADTGLRGLVGSGRSRVSRSAAMRARDVARPTPDDLAAAEASVVVRRRPWPEPPATPGSPLTPRPPRRRPN